MEFAPAHCFKDDIVAHFNQIARAKAAAQAFFSFKHLRSAGLCSLAVLASITSAQAAPIVPNTTLASTPVVFCASGVASGNQPIDLINRGCISSDSRAYTGQGDGRYSNAGGGDPELKVEEAILDATGRVVDLVLYGKSDDNPALFSFSPGDPEGTLTGTFRVIDPGVQIRFLTVKAANSFALFEFAGNGVNAGSFSTAGLLNNGGNQPGVSHISFFTVRQTPVNVSEPHTLALLGGALLAMGALRRRVHS
jgi:hypothetical protein